MKFNCIKDTHTAAMIGSIVGITVYLILACAKLIASYIFHSQALFADGLNNFSDIITSLAVLIGLFISRKPADEDHTFGHDKYESISSFVVSLIMFLIGSQVVIKGATQLWLRHHVIVDLRAIWVPLMSVMLLLIAHAIISIIVNQTYSVGLNATKTDMRNDILITLGTIFGIIGGQYGLPWLDALISLIVGIIIIISAAEIFKESTLTLSDAYDPDSINEYRNFITQIPEVKRVSRIRGRISARKEYLDITIEVDPLMTVYDSHAVTQRIETYLTMKYGIQDIDIHVEPYKEIS